MCPARSGCCVSTCRAGDGTWHEWPRPCGRGKEQPRSQGRSAALGTTHRTTRRGRLLDPESPARLCLSCALTCQTRSLRGLGAMLGAEGGPAECMRFCSCACCGDPALRALGALGSPPAERLGRPVCLAVTAAGDAPFHTALSGDTNFRNTDAREVARLARVRLAHKPRRGNSGRQEEPALSPLDAL